MDFSKVTGLLGQIAPTIATALGGPVAGMAVKALSSAIFGRDDAGPAEVQEALQNATPDQLLAIKRADQDFAVKMRELEIDLERIAVDDRKSARDMQIATRDWLPKTMAIMVTVGFFGILIHMLAYGMPENGTEALLIMIGSLGTAWTGIINFYYGSSAGSQKKTDALAAKAG